MDARMFYDIYIYIHYWNYSSLKNNRLVVLAILLFNSLPNKVLEEVHPTLACRGYGSIDGRSRKETGSVRGTRP